MISCVWYHIKCIKCSIIPEQISSTNNILPQLTVARQATHCSVSASWPFSFWDCKAVSQVARSNHRERNSRSQDPFYPTWAGQNLDSHQPIKYWWFKPVSTCSLLIDFFQTSWNQVVEPTMISNQKGQEYLFDSIPLRIRLKKTWPNCE